MLTGWAAPIFVPGAIAAIWAARVMNTPADAALLPLGETKTITGTSLPIISFTIFLMEVSSPPGVSSSITRASTFFSFAFLILFPINSDETGLITPLTVITITLFLFGFPSAESMGNRKKSEKLKTRTLTRINLFF